MANDCEFCEQTSIVVIVMPDEEGDPVDTPICLDCLTQQVAHGIQCADVLGDLVEAIKADEDTDKLCEEAEALLDGGGDEDGDEEEEEEEAS